MQGFMYLFPMSKESTVLIFSGTKALEFKAKSSHYLWDALINDLTFLDLASFFVKQGTQQVLKNFNFYALMYGIKIYLHR